MAGSAAAERAFVSSVTGWREAGHLTTTAVRWYELVLVRRAQGRLDAAVLTCEQALDSLVTSGRPLPAAGPGYVGLAEIAYQRDELDSALRHATEGIALCRQFVHTTPLAGGLATLAMIRQATGDPAGALEAITEAGQAAPGPAGLLNPVPAQRARLLLAQGDLPAAARFPPDNGLGPDDEPDYARESGHLVLARILLAQDRPGQALALLDRLHAAAKAQGRAGSLIETGALRALALAAAGDEAARSPPSPRRSCSPARSATSGSSPTRARRWPRCSGGSSRPSAPARPPPRSRSATWPGSSAPSAPDGQRAIPSLPASSTR